MSRRWVAGTVVLLLLPVAVAAQSPQRVPGEGGRGLQVEAAASQASASIAVTADRPLAALEHPQPDEVVLRYAGPIDGEPATVLPRQLSAWVRDVRYGYDSLLLVFTGPMRLDFDAIGGGVAMTLRRAESGSSGGTAEAEAAEAAELDVLRVQYLRQAGRRRQARRLAQQLTRQEPDNLDAWLNLAELLEASGRWRQALAAYRRAHALAPQRSYPAESVRRLERAHRPYVRTASTLQTGAGLTALETVTEARDFVAPRWAVGARQRTDALAVASYRRADGGVGTDTRAVRPSASGFLRYHLPVGATATGRLYLSGAGLGLGGALVDPWANGKTALRARLNAGPAEPVEARLQSAALDSVTLRRQQSLTVAPVFMSASTAWQRYRLAGTAATRAQLRASAFWTVVDGRPSWTLGYSVGASYPLKRPSRTASDGTSYAPIPLQRAETHTLQAGTERRLGPDLTGSAALGYSVDRPSGGHGPFVSARTTWELAAAWRLRGNAGYGLRWQEGGSATVTLGAELVWHYADSPAAGLRRWLHSG